MDIVTGKVARLTDHPTAVVDFDLVAGRDQFIYAAVTPVDWSERIAHGYVVETQTLVEVMGKGRVQLPAPVAYFVGDRRARSARPVQIAPYRLPSEAHPYGVWLAPDGRHAVALRYVPDAPEAWWTQYEPVARIEYLKGAKDNAHFAASHPAIFMQYMLVDLATGTARPLVQAPAAYLFAGIDTSAHWTGPNSVVLSNTFLPLEGAEGETLARRARPLSRSRSRSHGPVQAGDGVFGRDAAEGRLPGVATDTRRRAGDRLDGRAADRLREEGRPMGRGPGRVGQAVAGVEGGAGPQPAARGTGHSGRRQPHDHRPESAPP